MSTIDQFLNEINQILRTKNGQKLNDYLVIEPPLPHLYTVIVKELRQSSASGRQDDLEAKCKKLLVEYEEGDTGGSWPAFTSFLVQYFVFLREVNVDHLVETHDMLKALLNICILALSDASMGIVVLPTVVSFSRTLARLAIGLDKRPDLIAHLTQRESVRGGDDTAERVTLVESSANVIREAFKKCLSERSGNASGLDSNGKPDGRRIGIYVCANLCLKLFFHCRKLRSAEQIFGNIYSQSPPLPKFPASQRVTFLYYLGRYLFANNHFYRAQLALQAAYDQCHSQAFKQRRSILIYLITSNIVLGRFPSFQLLQQPEAIGLSDRFLPICQAIRRGDLATFRIFLDLDNTNGDWFLKRRLLLPLRNRCEVLVWRSLARKTYLLSGFRGDSTKRAPSLDLQDMLVLASSLEEHAQTQTSTPNGRNSFANGHFDTSNAQQYVYVDPDLEGEVDPEDGSLLTMDEIESVVASLINQSLLHGYVSHRYLRMVITGAKTRPALEIGFPNVWNVIQAKVDGEVPGWVKEQKRVESSSGMVVNLKGARPAGAASAG